MVKGIVTASKTHHFRDTCSSVSPKSKNVVLNIAEMNVPGRKSMVIAAMVIIEAESRWVCFATSAVEVAIFLLI